MGMAVVEQLLATLGLLAFLAQSAPITPAPITQIPAALDDTVLPTFSVFSPHSRCPPHSRSPRRRKPSRLRTLLITQLQIHPILLPLHPRPPKNKNVLQHARREASLFAALQPKFLCRGLIESCPSGLRWLTIGCRG